MNQTIRARIHDSAVRRVTRIYASTLSDVFLEALQNSRRGGATRVRIFGRRPERRSGRVPPPERAKRPSRSPSPTTASASPIPPSC